MFYTHYIVEHHVAGYWLHFGTYHTIADALAACNKAPGDARWAGINK